MVRTAGHDFFLANAMNVVDLVGGNQLSIKDTRSWDRTSSSGRSSTNDSHLHCLSSFLPSMDDLRSTKQGTCQFFPSMMAVKGLFSSVRPHLNCQKLIVVCQMCLKSGKCPVNILVGTRSYKEGENPPLTSVGSKTVSTSWHKYWIGMVISGGFMKTK